MLYRRFCNLEISLYFVVYITYLLFGLWAIFRARDKIVLSSRFEFDEGWSIFSRPRDDCNDEMIHFSEFMSKMWWFYVAHLIGNRFMCLKFPHALSYWHAFITAAALLTTFELVFSALMVLLLLSYLVVMTLDSRAIVWLVSIVWMIIINQIKSSNQWSSTFGNFEYFILCVTLAWTLLRCCSFSLNRIKSHKMCIDKFNHIYSTKSYIGYTLYLPCLSFGPFLDFRRYITYNIIDEGIVKDKLSTFKQQLFALCLDLLRVSFWWIVLQVSMHYIYIYYMTQDESAVKLVNPPFARHAIAYFLGQGFFLFYTVTYGLGIALARFDGLNPPQRPRCIGRIHYYSDMWKYFDTGLYEFLFQNIYIELSGKQTALLRRLFASAVTFSFVFIWHGSYFFVLLWSILNFACLLTEKFLKIFLRSQRYTKWSERWLSQRTDQRLQALLGSQVFLPAAFANVYFIGGPELGNVLVRGAYMNGFWNFIGLTLCSYCFFQCAEFVSKKKDQQVTS